MKRMLMLLLGTTLVLLAPGCKEDPPIGPEEAQAGSNSTIEGLVQGAGEVPLPAAYECVDSSDQIDSLIGNMRFLITRKTVKLAKRPDMFPLYNPNAEVIFPGSLIQGKTRGYATPDRIVAKRGPGIITLDIVTGSDPKAEVEEVNVSNVQQAINGIISRNPGIMPAATSIDIKKVYSREQAKYEGDFGIDLGIFDMGGSLSFSEDRRYNRLLVRLSQRYYTVIAERPTTFSKWFDPGVTVEQLRPQISEGNPPLYVSSVVFGRIFYVLIESTTNIDTMSVHASASLFGIFGGGGGTNQISTLANLRVKTYALGGRADEMIRAMLTSDLAQLRSLLSTSADIRTGAPISYTLRSVASDQIVKNGLLTEYDLVDAVPIPMAVGEPRFHYIADGGNVVLDSYALGGWLVSQWKDRSPSHNHATMVTQAIAGPMWMTNFVSGRFAVVDCRAVAIPRLGRRLDALVFNGNGLAGTDYTVVAVVNYEMLQRPKDPDADEFVYLLNGAGSSPLKRLQIGFFDDKIKLQHQGSEALIATVPSAYKGGTHVYTFRFSRREGMAIFVDGVQIGKKASLTEPLSEFRSAILGCTGTKVTQYPLEMTNPAQNGMLRIAQVSAFPSALSDAVRAGYEKYLRDEFELW